MYKRSFTRKSLAVFHFGAPAMSMLVSLALLASVDNTFVSNGKLKWLHWSWLCLWIHFKHWINNDFTHMSMKGAKLKQSGQWLLHAADSEHANFQQLHAATLEIRTKNIWSKSFIPSTICPHMFILVGLLCTTCIKLQFRNYRSALCNYIPVITHSDLRSPVCLLGGRLKALSTHISSYLRVSFHSYSI